MIDTEFNEIEYFLIKFSENKDERVEFASDYRGSCVRFAHPS